MFPLDSGRGRPAEEGAVSLWRMDQVVRIKSLVDGRGGVQITSGREKNFANFRTCGSSVYARLCFPESCEGARKIVVGMILGGDQGVPGGTGFAPAEKRWVLNF